MAPYLLHRVVDAVRATRGVVARRRRRVAIAAAPVAVVLLASSVVAVPSATAEPTAPVDRIEAHEWQVTPAAAGGVYSGSFGRPVGPPREAVGLWTNAEATAWLDSPPHATRLVIEAAADLCEGPPRMQVVVNDDPTPFVLTVNADYSLEAVPGWWETGPTKVTLRFLNDHRTADCDRNLKVGRVWMDRGDGTNSGQVWRTAEGLERSPEDAGTVFTQGRYGEPVQLLWSRATVRAELSVPAGYDQPHVVAVLDAHECEGPARARFHVNGTLVTTFDVVPATGEEWQVYRFPVSGTFYADPHVVELSFVNDIRTPECDRNLMVKAIGLTNLVPGD